MRNMHRCYDGTKVYWTVHRQTNCGGVSTPSPSTFMYTVLLKVTLTLTLTNTSFSLAILWSSVRALRPMYSRSVQSFQSHHRQCLHFPVIHRSTIRLLVLFHNNQYKTFVFSKMCWIFSIVVCFHTNAILPEINVWGDIKKGLVSEIETLTLAK